MDQTRNSLLPAQYKHWTSLSKRTHHLGVLEMRLLKLSPTEFVLLCSTFWGLASKQINKAPNSTPTLPKNWATLPWDGAIPEGKQRLQKMTLISGEIYLEQWKHGTEIRLSFSLKLKTPTQPFPQIPPREDEVNFPASQ